MLLPHPPLWVPTPEQLPPNIPAPTAGSPVGLTPLLGVGSGGGLRLQSLLSPTPLRPQTRTRVCAKSFLETFIFLKGQDKKSIKCWPGLRAGLAAAAWVAERYEKQMESSLEPGQAIVFTTKSTSQLEAIHVPTTLHRAFPRPTCRMTVPSGC